MYTSQEAADCLERIIKGEKKMYAVISTPNQGPVNVRSQPWINQNIQYRWNNGTTVEVIRIESGSEWYYCKQNGKYGYIRRDFLRMVSMDAPFEACGDGFVADEGNG